MKIKNYQLNKNVTLKKLENAKFERGGWMNEVSEPKVHFYKPLYEDIELHIEIPIGDLKHVDFSDKNICVFDEKFGQPYYPFYRLNTYFPYLENIIIEYNKVMDELVEKKILVEKLEK